MNTRQAVINPGSSSWWLLSLAPLLYFKKIRVSPADLDSVREQEGKSTYHTLVSGALSSLQKETGKDIIIPDSSLPARGKSPAVAKQTKELTDQMLDAAGRWRATRPSVVRPAELKAVLSTAYREWIRYNKKKASLLPARDPLCRELVETQIPRWSSILNTIDATPARNLPDFLAKNADLRQVLEDVVRNAVLLVSIGEKGRERAFDALAPEFLPAIELVERIRVFGSPTTDVAGNMRFDLLVTLHNVRLEQIARNTSGMIEKPQSIVIQALKERGRFSALRKRLSDLDESIKMLTSPDRAWLKQVIQLVKETNREVERIEKLGAGLMWLSGAYVLSELLAGYDPLISKAIRTLLVNPLTTKAAKDALKNLHLAHKGFGPGAAAALAVIRDYVALRRLADVRLSTGQTAKYDFWV